MKISSGSSTTQNKANFPGPDASRRFALLGACGGERPRSRCGEGVSLLLKAGGTVQPTWRGPSRGWRKGGTPSPRKGQRGRSPYDAAHTGRRTPTVLVVLHDRTARALHSGAYMVKYRVCSWVQNRPGIQGPSRHVNTAMPHPVWRMRGCRFHGSPDRTETCSASSRGTDGPIDVEQRVPAPVAGLEGRRI